jgi:AcrR family transcriptional regulator
MTEIARGSAEERLLRAAGHLAGRDGYARLTVERVLEEASVSRASFYQHYGSLDDCFASAYRLHGERLAAEIEVAVARRSQPELSMLDALVATAISRPHVAHLLMSEGHASGISGLRERDRLITHIEQVIAACAPAPELDIPTSLLVGATFRFLSMRLTEGAVSDGLGAEVREWARTFAGHPARPDWGTRFIPVLTQSAQPGPSFAPALRPRLGRTPRRLILEATAAAICERGFAATSVSDIVVAAGTSRRSFYNEFSNKAAAAIAAYEQGFQRVLGVCTPAFFGSELWPDRVWDSALAVTAFLAREPWLAYFGFVECYAIGREFASRVHSTQLAFTLFLEEGYRQHEGVQLLSRASSALIAACTVELGFRASRGPLAVNIRRVQPLAVYITLAPFIGAEAAGRFVASRLGGPYTHAPAAA